MHTYESLMNDLRNSGVEPTGTLMIHSSMKAIGEVEGGADTVLDALMSYMKDGLLLLPTHTWDDSNNANGIYDYRTEKSCVGLLTNMFMKRKGVVRSLHPTHSMAAFGARAMDYVSRDDTVITEGISSPSPRNGCFGGLLDEKATVLMLGAAITSYTYGHCVEERLNLPYLLVDEPKNLKVVGRDGNAHSVAVIAHQSHEPFHASSFFGRLEGPLETAGAIKRVQIGDAKSMLIDTVIADRVIEQLLTDEPKLLTQSYQI